MDNFPYFPLLLNEAFKIIKLCITVIVTLKHPEAISLILISKMKDKKYTTKSKYIFISLFLL